MIQTYSHVWVDGDITGSIAVTHDDDLDEVRFTSKVRIPNAHVDINAIRDGDLDTWATSQELISKTIDLSVMPLPPPATPSETIAKMVQIRGFENYAAGDDPFDSYFSTPVEIRVIRDANSIRVNKRANSSSLTNDTWTTIYDVDRTENTVVTIYSALQGAGGGNGDFNVTFDDMSLVEVGTEIVVEALPFGS